MTEWLVAEPGCETLPLLCRKALLPFLATDKERRHTSGAFGSRKRSSLSQSGLWDVVVEGTKELYHAYFRSRCFGRYRFCFGS